MSRPVHTDRRWPRRSPRPGTKYIGRHWRLFSPTTLQDHSWLRTPGQITSIRRTSPQRSRWMGVRRRIRALVQPISRCHVQRGMIITGHVAPRMTFRLTDPRSMPTNPPRPCVPTTTSCAACAWSSSACAGRSRTDFRKSRHRRWFAASTRSYKQVARGARYCNWRRHPEVSSTWISVFLGSRPAPLGSLWSWILPQ